jgi:hypothetical protein
MLFLATSRSANLYCVAHDLAGGPVIVIIGPQVGTARPVEEIEVLGHPYTEICLDTKAITSPEVKLEIALNRIPRKDTLVRLIAKGPLEAMGADELMV